MNKKVKIGFLFFMFFITGISASNLVYESIRIENGQPYDNLGPGYPVFMLYLVFNYFASLYLATKKYLQSRGIEKKKLAYVTFGNFAFVFFVMITNLILPIFGVVIVDLQESAPLWSLLFIIPAFYALRRYRFFNFSNASLNSLRVITILLFYASSVVLTYYVFQIFSDHGLVRGILSSVVGLLIYEFSRKKMPILLTARFRELKNALITFKTKIYHCNSYAEMEKIAEEIFLVALNFVNVKVLVVRKKEDEIDLPVYQENIFTRLVSKYAKDALIKDEIQFISISKREKTILRKEMIRLNADLCLPLFSEKKLIGFLILKRKNQENPYSREELKEILSIKSHLEIALMNVLLKMNLQEENNLMKTIIDEKTKELKNKIKQINELVQQQADFIAVTAHEFRTPLSIASFQLEDILNSDDDLNKKVVELKVIDDSIDSLKLLTEKLFAIQQYDLNKVTLNLEKIELKEFLKKIHREFIPIMKEKSLRFDLKIQPIKKVFVKIDRLQIRQVLHNLLKNASKFTSEHGSISLKLMEQKGNAIICVDDDGEGIPDNLKKSIFEKFRTKASGAGIGLGLYLCKKTIELHKGKIWLEDAERGGASFKIKLKMIK